ncbi:MAG: FeS-binding protein [Candidatus Bathyarchaeota archaeon]|nr:FeS-binding protein [Candidatus Bathyarchaeota archaeon]MDH5788827.1 FeS-binding protein [Candidatus Bathyarchaeota archaeon]
MKSCSEELLLHLTERGFQGRIVSARRLHDLQEAIEGFHRKGLVDEEFYQERLAWFDFRIPDSLPKAKSIIVVAVPRPQSQAVFKWNGESQTLILPPTYVAYDDTRKMVEDIVEEILEPKGHRIARTKLPLKLLAVRSGLGTYGRNNICYVVGMGSFLQLVAVYSDMPCHKDSWRKVQMMKRCQNCHACRLKCPTGAIASDRFLLCAERCIVFHNEKPGDIPFPTWIDPSWHNCLVGCLHCQKICPENKDFLQWIEGREQFSEKETALLLCGVALDQLSAQTVRKLKKLDLIEYQASLSRNLGVFIRR